MAEHEMLFDIDENGVICEHKEPFCTIEVATEEDYNELVKAVEFYKTHKGE